MGEDAAPVPPDAEPLKRYAPRTIGGVFYMGILAMTVVALVIASTTDWRLGIKILSAALGVAALARLALPAKDAGMLAVRHRILDVVILLGIGIALFVLALTIPDQPV